MSRKRERILREAIIARDEDAQGDLAQLVALREERDELVQRQVEQSAAIARLAEENERLNKMLVLLATQYSVDGEKRGVYASPNTLIAMVRNKVNRDD